MHPHACLAYLQLLPLCVRCILRAPALLLVLLWLLWLWLWLWVVLLLWCLLLLLLLLLVGQVEEARGDYLITCSTDWLLRRVVAVGRLLLLSRWLGEGLRQGLL